MSEAQLATHEDVGGNSILMVIDRAARDETVDIEKMEKLLDMQERIMKMQSKAAFDSALAAFQAEITPVPRTKDGHNGKYAPLDQVDRHVKRLLETHGFSYRFRTEPEAEGYMHVTCILSHVSGHSETSSFSAPPDDSGKKNAIQARGSARSYAQRYTLLDVLGLPTTDDTDGDAELSAIQLELEALCRTSGVQDEELSGALIEAVLKGQPDFWRTMPKKVLRYAASQEGWAKLFGKEEA
jgi:hypothetical protein